MASWWAPTRTRRRRAPPLWLWKTLSSTFVFCERRRSCFGRDARVSLSRLLFTHFGPWGKFVSVRFERERIFRLVKRRWFLPPRFSPMRFSRTQKTKKKKRLEKRKIVSRRRAIGCETIPTYLAETANDCADKANIVRGMECNMWRSRGGKCERESSRKNSYQK